MPSYRVRADWAQLLRILLFKILLIKVINKKYESNRRKELASPDILRISYKKSHNQEISNGKQSVRCMKEYSYEDIWKA